MNDGTLLPAVKTGLLAAGFPAGLAFTLFLTSEKYQTDSAKTRTMNPVL
jgi:hypothetical protein